MKTCINNLEKRLRKHLKISLERALVAFYKINIGHNYIR